MTGRRGLHRPPPLTPRQEYVLVRLHEEQRWSATEIGKTLNLGRRQVENALRRQGVILSQGRPLGLRGRGPIGHAAAISWFADATRPLADPHAASRATTAATGAVTLAFRRRRCTDCGTLTEYQIDCPVCRRSLDLPPRDERAATVTIDIPHRTNSVPYIDRGVCATTLDATWEECFDADGL